jgi:hypothetical protein
MTMASTESEIAREPHTAGGVARSTLTVVLIVLSVVSLTLAPMTIWARNLVLDTDGYVSTVAPLAASPAIQNEVIKAVVKQVDDHLDLKTYVDQVLPPAAVKRLQPILRTAALNLVNTITTKLVQSPRFQQLWTSINRVAHEQIVSLLLTGGTVRGIIKVENDNIVLDLSQVVSLVKQRLVSAGVGIAARVPTFGATITIAHLAGFTRIQRVVQALNAIANFLPWIGLALAAAALIAARRRIRAGIALALGLAGGMCVLALALLVGEQLFTAPLVARGLTQEAATVLFDTVVRNLKTALRVILVVALLIAAALWAARFAPEIHIPPSAWDRVLVPFRTSPARFVARYANPFRIGVVALPLAILILMDGPPLGLVITFLCLVIIALGLIELCRRGSRLSLPPPGATDQALTPPSPTGQGGNPAGG